MGRNKGVHCLYVLNILMNTDGYLTKKEISSKVGCHIKSVEPIIDRLETSGFGIDVVKERGKATKYKYIGLYGF